MEELMPSKEFWVGALVEGLKNEASRWFHSKVPTEMSSLIWFAYSMAKSGGKEWLKTYHIPCEAEAALTDPALFNVASQACLRWQRLCKGSAERAAKPRHDTNWCHGHPPFGRITQADVEEMHETLQWLEEFLWNQAVSAAWAREAKCMTNWCCWLLVCASFVVVLSSDYKFSNADECFLNICNPSAFIILHHSSSFYSLWMIIHPLFITMHHYSFSVEITMNRCSFSIEITMNPYKIPMNQHESHGFYINPFTAPFVDFTARTGRWASADTPCGADPAPVGGPQPWGFLPAGGFLLGKIRKLGWWLGVLERYFRVSTI